MVIEDGLIDAHEAVAFLEVRHIVVVGLHSRQRRNASEMGVMTAGKLKLLAQGAAARLPAGQPHVAANPIAIEAGHGGGAAEQQGQQEALTEA